MGRIAFVLAVFISVKMIYTSKKLSWLVPSRLSIEVSGDSRGSQDETLLARPSFVNIQWTQERLGKSES